MLFPSWITVAATAYPVHDVDMITGDVHYSFHLAIPIWGTLADNGVGHTHQARNISVRHVVLGTERWRPLSPYSTEMILPRLACIARWVNNRLFPSAGSSHLLQPSDIGSCPME